MTRGRQAGQSIVEYTVAVSLIALARLRWRIERDGQVLGIISIGDLVKSIIAEQEFVIEQMTHYIAGTMA